MSATAVYINDVHVQLFGHLLLRVKNDGKWSCGHRMAMVDLERITQSLAEHAIQGGLCLEDEGVVLSKLWKVRCLCTTAC